MFALGNKAHLAGFPEIFEASIHGQLILLLRYVELREGLNWDLGFVWAEAQ